MLHAFCPPVASIRLQLPPLRDVALANSESVSLRLTISGIAASLHGHDHAIDTRENIDVDRDNARYVIVQYDMFVSRELKLAIFHHKG
jgi:hypothetical protein